MARVHGVRRSIRGIAATGALTLGLAACSFGPFADSGANASGTSQSPDPGVTAPPQGQEHLARFYSQQLAWETCEQAQCAWLEVPVDYSRPDGETLKLRVLKVPARGGGAKPALFVNPGGPGGSAVDYAKLANFIVTPTVREAYDVVGVDPRGVGQSNPIVCIDDAAMDRMNATDPTPDTPAEYAQFLSVGQSFGKACEQKYPGLLPHVGTDEVAKDMDIARAALGQDRMVYLGKSYGTFLGATYADLFPARVGRLVLDGALPPDLSSEDMSLGQAEGFETATRAYVANCVATSRCPLGSNLEAGMQSLQQILADLDSKPLPVRGDTRVSEIGEGWGSLGMVNAMYDERLWPRLTTALRSATAGDGTDLFALGSEYADRDASGRYQSNLMQVIVAVNCLDRPTPPDTEATRQERIAKFTQVAPTWGKFMAETSICQEWPVKGTREPHRIAAAGADPILVVGTTRDPATPYSWSQRLAEQLDQARLLTFDGDGHTAYHRSNECVDTTVDDYLVQGKVPDADVKC